MLCACQCALPIILHRADDDFMNVTKLSADRKSECLFLLHYGRAAAATTATIERSVGGHIIEHFAIHRSRNDLFLPIFCCYCCVFTVEWMLLVSAGSLCSRAQLSFDAESAHMQHIRLSMVAEAIVYRTEYCKISARLCADHKEKIDCKFCFYRAAGIASTRA